MRRGVFVPIRLNDGAFLYESNNQGAGVRVYIIDSGMQNVGLRVVGDFSAIPGGSTDDAFHNHNDLSGGYGTKVASLVASALGVGKQADLVNVKVLFGDGGDTTARILSGIDFMTQDRAAHPNDAAVANMSFTIPWNDQQQVFEQAVIDAIDGKIIVVAGAGNMPNDTVGDACGVSPAGLGSPTSRNYLYNPRGRSTITVSASNAHDQRTGFYNGQVAAFGPCVDLFAPGLSVKSLASFGYVETFDGTSAASPVVAGVIVAYLQGRGSNYDPNDVEAILKRNATSGVLTNLGSGSPNLLVWSRVDLWQ